MPQLYAHSFLGQWLPMLQVCSLLVLPPKTSGFNNPSKVLDCLPPLWECLTFTANTLVDRMLSWLKETMAETAKKANQSCNKAELLLTPQHQSVKKRVLVQLCVKCDFCIPHSVFLGWFFSSIFCSGWPQTVTALSGWIWLLLFISCHFPSDQIQGVGCLPSPRVSPLWPDITSLKQPP